MRWFKRLWAMPQKAAAFDEMIAAQWRAQQQAAPYWSLGLNVPDEWRVDHIPGELDRWADDGGREP